MKTNLIFLASIAFTTLVSFKTNLSLYNNKNHSGSNPGSVYYKDKSSETYIRIYKFNETYTDSSLVCEQWFSSHMLMKKKGEFYWQLPVQSEFADDHIIAAAKGKSLYKTFNPLTCETGGNSAWNKYLLKYDHLQRPIEIKHYKAFMEAYDKKGNAYKNKKPNYKLAESIFIEYMPNERIQTTFNDSNKVIEKIIKRYDKDSQLVFEHWEAWDEYRYKIYYENK